MILAVDQGTTGTTCLVLDEELTVVSRAYRPITQHFPRPGWVEHDPEEIWRSVREAAEDAVRAAGTGDLAAIGITNQRETTVSSASAIVESRWAMISVVRPRIASRNPSRMRASVVASTEAVASSRMRIRGFMISARAIAIR